jgi:ribulose 1,5-bisphosphate synthetase/thiazole synthase
MTSEFDVIISGAGPAGVPALAWFIGLRIALIEKNDSQGKVCGDASYVPKCEYYKS